MKGAVASVEVFATRGDRPVERLTLTVTAPERGTDVAKDVWLCRVALARRHRPQTLEAADSISALRAALALGEGWLAGLAAEGFTLWRDRAATRPFEL
jgi:hypothetical protein